MTLFTFPINELILGILSSNSYLMNFPVRVFVCIVTVIVNDSGSSSMVNLSSHILWKNLYRIKSGSDG